MSKRCPAEDYESSAKAVAEGYEVAPEYYAQLVANLKQRGRSKPGTVEKLKATIASMFQKIKLSKSSGCARARCKAVEQS